MDAQVRIPSDAPGQPGQPGQPGHEMHHIRFPVDLSDRVRAEAKAKRRSFTAQVLWLVEQAFAAQEPQAQAQDGPA